MIAVGAIAQRLVDEQMARHAPHHGEHALVGDLAAGELLLDHPRAGRLVRVARPLHYPLRGFLIGAAVGVRRGGRPVSPLSCAFSRWSEPKRTSTKSSAVTVVIPGIITRPSDSFLLHSRYSGRYRGPTESVADVCDVLSFNEFP
jgi:hypothetical protein